MLARSKSGTINLWSTYKGRAIEEVGSNNHKIDKIGVMDVDSTRFIKLKFAKFKYLV